MVDKLVLKQIILNNREEIEQYQIVHRDVQSDGFNCCIFVGVWKKRACVTPRAE